MSVVTVGPKQVRGFCNTAGELLTEVVLPEAKGTREEWAAAAAAAQHVVNAAAAVQNACIARLAAIETEVLDDGTWVERHKAPGYVALDCAAILSGALNVTATHAEHRVIAAVALAADGPAGTIAETGLGGLHDAMRAGRLDPYRAGVIVDELEIAPPEVRDAVITALDPWFDVEDGPHLRRRTRTHLARISPDLLRQRAEKARANSGLRRWVDQPGVDTWEGTFPSEEAAQAWAAIDALAQQYVQDGTCTTIERARAKALTDLVAGNSTVQYVVTLTVPATLTEATTEVSRAAPATADTATSTVVSTEPGSTAAPRVDAPNAGDLIEVGGLRPGDQALVARGWLDAVLAGASGSTTLAGCHPVTGALLADDHPPGPTRPSPRSNGHKASTDHTRRNDDPPPTRPEPADSADPPVGRTSYRPSPGMAALVKARDGRCRFPGCAIAARFCDLDHVRPWPAGPTHPTNLICLCRRHHRTKQRHGWHVALSDDGTTTWTDPTGRQRTTWPRDALHALVLARPTTDTADGQAPAAVGRAPVTQLRTEIPDGPHSHLEFVLEHLGAAPAGTTPATRTSWREHRGPHRTDLTRSTRTGATIETDPGTPWPHHRSRRSTRCRFDDPPPF